MSTMALDNLAVHLEVAVERIRTGHAIESSDGMQADLPERILEVASHIAVQIEKHDGRGFSTAGGLLHCYASERQTDVPGKRNDLG